MPLTQDDLHELANLDKEEARRRLLLFANFIIYEWQDCEGKRLDIQDDELVRVLKGDDSRLNSHIAETNKQKAIEKRRMAIIDTQYEAHLMESRDEEP